MSALRESGAEELARTIEAEDVRVDPAEGWEMPDEWLEAGEMDIGNRQLQILTTPGHTQGHVVFADLERQLLFAGDHVLPHITPSIGLEAFPGESPLKDFLDSLAKVRALPDMKLFGAHGPAAESTHARIEELVAHHDGAPRRDARRRRVGAHAPAPLPTSRPESAGRGTSARSPTWIASTRCSR